jgi:hypothetical protein
VRFILTAIMAMLLCGCAVQPLDHQELGVMGSTRIVYVDMPSNLSAYVNNNGDKTVAGALFLFVSMGGGAIAYLIDKGIEHHAENTISPYSSIIESLPFRSDFLAQTRDVIRSSPWASRLPFSKVQYMDDDIENAEKALQTGHTNSVVFIWPGVFLSDNGKNLIVTMHTAIYVAAQASDSGRFTSVKYKEKNFNYSYSYVMNDNKESWAQQKQDAKMFAGLSLSGHVRYWMKDDAAQVRSDFNDALPKIEANLRRYYGAPAASLDTVLNSN